MPLKNRSSKFPPPPLLLLLLSFFFPPPFQLKSVIWNRTLCFCSEPPSAPPPSHPITHTVETHLAGSRALPTHAHTHTQMHMNAQQTWKRQVSVCKNTHTHRHLCFWQVSGKCHFLRRMQMGRGGGWRRANHTSSCGGQTRVWPFFILEGAHMLTGGWGRGSAARCLCVGFLIANKVMLKNMEMMSRTEVIMNPHFYKAVGNCAVK